MKELETILKRLDDIESLLLSKKNILNVNELVKYSGLSKSTIYKLTSSNQIPFYRPGGKNLFFTKSEIDCWLLKNRNSTFKEIEENAINYVFKEKKQINSL